MKRTTLLVGKAYKNKNGEIEWDCSDTDGEFLEIVA